MSAASSTNTLPDISTTTTNLVEAARNTARSPPPCSPAGGSERLEPSSTPMLLGRRASSTSPRAGTSLRAATAPPCIPRPPSTSPREHTATRPRRVLEYVRLPKSEVDHKDRAITSLRAENLQLQATVRELQIMQESHAMLQSACVDMAQCLGCTVEGVAAESVRDVLHSQASGVLQDREHIQQQLRGSRAELESSKSETAAVNVRLSSLDSQLQQARAALASRDSEIQQQKHELERLQQSDARNNTALESLRQQLAEVEEGRGERGQSLPELYTEIGRLKSAIKEKDGALQVTQGQVEASQAECEEMRARATSIGDMYEDLCSQLTLALQLEETDTHDVDSLVSEVEQLSQECVELRLRADTLTKTLKTCELDSRASRETILRLVAEAKKHEKIAAELSELHQAKMEQETLLASLERERDSYQERLLAAKQTMEAQEKELQGKESRINELASNWHSLKSVSDTENELLVTEQQKYEELCKNIGSLIGSPSSDGMELLQSLEQTLQTQQQLRERLKQREEKEAEGEKLQLSLHSQLSETEKALEREREKVKQLEGELVTHSVMKEEMDRTIEKEREFYQRLSKAMKLDSATARVLTGDFARDAILVRAEQIAKHETQALAEKQSAFYSAQRHLKMCRQTLESKEVYLALLQKKAANLEEKVQGFVQREAQLESMAGKSRKLEKQVERLKVKASQQAEDIERLKAECDEMASLKTLCDEQESEIGRLSGRVEQLNEARSEQARQLAEARLRVQSISKERQGERERETRQLQDQQSHTRELEQEFSTFRTAVERLLSDIAIDGAAGEAKGETPSDYDLIAQLERLAADHKELRNTVKCLGSSLQQLEQGFKAGYSDTLTILQTKA